MINSWTNANYLGHKNLKKALDMLKRSKENIVLFPPAIAACTGADYRGEGTYGACALIQAGTTFSFRIEDAMYSKGKSLIVGILSAAQAVTTAKYRAGVILIDAAGTYSIIRGEESDGSVGGKTGAVNNLIDALNNTDLEDKAVVAVFVAGDGSNAFLSTASLLVGTNLDLYSCGGMALSSGLSTDGQQLLGLL